MNEKKVSNRQDVKGTRRGAARKRSYRPVQYGLVVTAFLASFMGAVWLQRQESSAEASLLASSAELTSAATASAMTAIPTDELVVVPVAPVLPTDAVVAEAPMTVDDDQWEAESEEDDDGDYGDYEDEEEESEAVIVALPTPTATVPPVPTATASAPSAQLAARQTAPRAVARSRSSR